METNDSKFVKIVKCLRNRLIHIRYQTRSVVVGITTISKEVEDSELCSLVQIQLREWSFMTGVGLKRKWWGG